MPYDYEYSIVRIFGKVPDPWEHTRVRTIWKVFLEGIAEYNNR